MKIPIRNRVRVRLSAQYCDQLQSCHADSNLQDAIRAGEILTEVKERLEHGEYEPWVKANCSFNTVTAWRYMGLFEHRKSLSAEDLQSAYQQVAQIESREKQSEAQKARQRVAEYRKTGVKPEGWRRSGRITRDCCVLRNRENGYSALHKLAKVGEQHGRLCNVDTQKALPNDWIALYEATTLTDDEIAELPAIDRKTIREFKQTEAPSPYLRT